MDVIKVKQLNEDKSIAHRDQNIRPMISDEIPLLTHQTPAVFVQTVISMRVKVSDTSYPDRMFAAVKCCRWTLILPGVKWRVVAQR